MLMAMEKNECVVSGFWCLYVARVQDGEGTHGK